MEIKSSSASQMTLIKTRNEQFYIMIENLKCLEKEKSLINDYFDKVIAHSFNIDMKY
jgi:hypothetical protein